MANALMHRDYHVTAHGTQVRISRYPIDSRCQPRWTADIHSGHTDVTRLIDTSIRSTLSAFRPRGYGAEICAPGSLPVSFWSQRWYSLGLIPLELATLRTRRHSSSRSSCV